MAKTKIIEKQNKEVKHEPFRNGVFMPFDEAMNRIMKAKKSDVDEHLKHIKKK